MTADSHSVRASVAEILQMVCDEEAGEMLAVGLNEEVTGRLVEVLAERDKPPSVRLLVHDDVLKWLRDDFLLASTAAELLEADTLELRAATERLESTLLVTEESVVSLLRPDDEHSAGLATDDEEFVTAARERWNDLWESSEDFDLRTPAHSWVLESLAEEFSSEMESDFQRVLESVESTDGEGELDEVAVSLLVAAKHEQLLYDISRWGEDTGVASKATFSRTKTHFEEKGLLDTEKVPIDVGRPRLRLRLGDERLRKADVEELASVAQELLLAAPA